MPGYYVGAHEGNTYESRHPFEAASPEAALEAFRAAHPNADAIVVYRDFNHSKADLDPTAPFDPALAAYESDERHAKHEHESVDLWCAREFVTGEGTQRSR